MASLSGTVIPMPTPFNSFCILPIPGRAAGPDTLVDTAFAL